MIIHECEQNSDQWYKVKVKVGVPSASSFKDILAEGKGLTRKTVGSRWRVASER